MIELLNEYVYNTHDQMITAASVLKGRDLWNDLCDLLKLGLTVQNGSSEFQITSETGNNHPHDLLFNVENGEGVLDANNSISNLAEAILATRNTPNSNDANE